MNLQTLTRWKAFAIHLAISAFVAAIVVTLVVLLWYPTPYFSAMGGAVLLYLLIGVDVVLGPMITLIVFDPAKPRLKYDLATIAVLQLAALAYGSYIMFEARPVYTVFIGDRFNTVAANAIDADSLARAAADYRDLPLSGPRVVAARIPEDPRELANLVMGLPNGVELSELPNLYMSYVEVSPSAGRVSRPLVRLAQQSRENSAAIDQFVGEHGRDRNLGYVPVKARNKDFAAIVDRKTGEIVGYLAVNPW